jgi:hypothetical protein
MLRWLDKADPSEIYATALKCTDTHNALTMCDHVLLKEEGDESPIRARARFLKARLMLPESREESAYQLQKGLSDAKGVIPEDDPDVVEAKQVLRTLAPPDPDFELVQSYLKTLDNYLSQLSKQYEVSEVAARFSTIPAGWRIVSLIGDFNAHVQVEGFATYFANTLGYEGDAILDAFRKVDKKLATVVQKAFNIFVTNRGKHARSARKAAHKYKQYDIIPGGDAPGMFEGAHEVYSEVEEEYTRKAEGLYAALANYIRGNRSEFGPLPTI